MIVLTTITTLLVLIYCLECIRQKKLFLPTSLVFPLLLLTTSIVVSLIANSESKFESLIGSGLTYFFLITLSFILLTHPDQARTKTILHSFIAGSSLLAIFSIAELTLFHRFPNLPLPFHSRSFSPMGIPLNAILFMFLGSITAFLRSTHSKNTSLRYLLLIACVINLISVVAYVALMLPGGELSPLILPFRAGWNILLDVYKNVRALLLGVGLANFPSIFTQLRPLYLNNTMYWNTQFTSSSSEALQLATTTGLLGFGSFAFLLASTLTLSFRRHKELFVLLLIFSLFFFFFPSNLPLTTFFFLILGSLGETEQKEINLTQPSTHIIFSLITIGLLSYPLYLLTCFSLAEYHLHHAQVALSQNNAVTIYSETLEAVKLLPHMTNYHLSYSQINLALAGSISRQQSLSDEDKQQINQLSAQAVREAKYATTLQPSSSQAWNNLGVVYRNLVNVATGADQYATAAYAEAVSLDPANPRLRVEFGGLLQQLSGTTKEETIKNTLVARAAQEYQTAINLKADYANAYYNLAKILEGAKDYTNAYSAMQKTLSLLGPDSTDLTRVTSELETLKAQLPKPSASPTPSPLPENESSLSSPSPLPSPLPGGPVDLPTDTPTL